MLASRKAGLPIRLASSKVEHGMTSLATQVWHEQAVQNRGDIRKTVVRETIGV